MRLKSLSLNFLHHTDYARPQSLHPTAFPLVGLSDLKMLEIVEEKYIDWQTLSLATRQSIKFYDVHLWDSPGINLSLSPNLSVLQIVVTGETWSPISSTLRTLSDTESPIQSIQTLVLNVQYMDIQFERDDCAPLDRHLCSATLSRAGIQSEVDLKQNNALEESLRKAFLYGGPDAHLIVPPRTSAFSAVPPFFEVFSALSAPILTGDYKRGGELFRPFATSTPPLSYVCPPPLFQLAPSNLTNRWYLYFSVKLGQRLSNDNLVSPHPLVDKICLCS
ncbi:hypothetical protein R3P38DRAFT_463639 [Favolaschia claudopus]|uniref:Uncharacterized protein n=1 Tax=Favolaschia claudopus TaxID=2862362 RepID=A0AAV9ZFT6_9AGAR